MVIVPASTADTVTRRQQVGLNKDNKTEIVASWFVSSVFYFFSNIIENKNLTEFF